MAGKGISFRKGLGIDRTGVIGLSGAVPRMFLSPQKVLYTVHIKCYSLKKKNMKVNTGPLQVLMLCLVVVHTPFILALSTHTA